MANNQRVTLILSAKNQANRILKGFNRQLDSVRTSVASAQKALGLFGVAGGVGLGFISCHTQTVVYPSGTHTGKGSCL